MSLQAGDRFAEVRARHVLDRADLEVDVPLVRADSLTNEVWMSPDHVVRVNRSPDRRLAREAKLIATLPPEVLAPTVVDAGTGPGWDWMITERVRGSVLSRVWVALDPEDQRRAVSELMAAVRALHAVPSSAEPEELVSTPPHPISGPDPAFHVVGLIEKAAELSHVPPPLIERLIHLAERAGPHVDPWPTAAMVHGDLHFENVMWDDGITALLDFEWSRPGPRDLDLDVLGRFCSEPEAHVAADYHDEAVHSDYDKVLAWVADDYPELIDGSAARLPLYAIAFDVRCLLEHPPTGPLRTLPRHHPLRRLDKLARTGRPDIQL